MKDCSTCVSRHTPRQIFPCEECIAKGGQFPEKTYPRYRADYALIAQEQEENKKLIDGNGCVNYGNGQ